MIEIAYIVKERRGVERLRTAEKQAADAMAESRRTPSPSPSGWVRARRCAACPRRTRAGMCHAP
jgi:hypothetical protein